MRTLKKIEDLPANTKVQCKTLTEEQFNQIFSMRIPRSLRFSQSQGVYVFIYSAKEITWDTREEVFNHHRNFEISEDDLFVEEVYNIF